VDVSSRHSRTKAVTSICHPTSDPKDKYLVQVILIECEVCEGTAQIQIVGHHIPAVVRALQKALELYPDLCKETTTEVPHGVTVVIPPPGGRMM
jgi:hypothetical protein